MENYKDLRRTSYILVFFVRNEVVLSTCTGFRYRRT